MFNCIEIGFQCKTFAFKNKISSTCITSKKKQCNDLWYCKSFVGLDITLSSEKGFNVAKCQMQFTLEQGEVHNFIVNSIIIQLVFTSINSLKNPSQLIEFLSCKITPYYCWYGAWLNFFVWFIVYSPPFYQVLIFLCGFRCLCNTWIYVSCVSVHR